MQPLTWGFIVLLLCWAFFWGGVVAGMFINIVVTCDLRNIGWWFHDMYLDKPHRHRTNRIMSHD